MDPLHVVSHPLDGRDGLVTTVGIRRTCSLNRIVVVANGTPELRALAEGATDRVLYLSNLRRRKGVVEL